MSTIDEPAGTVPGFSIGVQGDWVIVDIEQAADEAAVSSLIDDRVAEGVIALESRDAAVEVVTRIAQDAQSGGVLFAAVLVADDELGPIVASVAATVATLPAVAPDEPPPDTLIEERIESRDGDDESVVMRRATNVKVQLPAGPAVRIERAISYDRGESLSQDVYAVQYLVPIDEAGTTITVTGISPSVRRKPELDGVFHEIASSLEIDRPPTGGQAT